MITSRTKDSLRFKRTDGMIQVQADQYGLVVTLTDPDGYVSLFPFTPSDTEILHQFLGESLPMWDQDEI
jgi:hypothetical protein